MSIVFLYVYQRVNPDTVHGDNITSSAEVLRGSSSFASEAYPPSHLAPRDTTSEFFGIPKSRRFPSKHFIRIIIIIINIIIINVTSKGYIAISIPSPAPAPSPTLHRVLVEQILSADDFLIFKVGWWDFWLWRGYENWWFSCDVRRISWDLTGNSWGLAKKTGDFHGFDARLWWVNGWWKRAGTTSLFSLEWRLGLG